MRAPAPGSERRSGGTRPARPRRAGPDAGGARRPARPVEDRDRHPPLPPAAKRWGNVARRGAREVARSHEDEGPGRPERRGPAGPPPPLDRWERVGEGPDPGWERAEARRAGAPGAPAPRRTTGARPLPSEVATEIRRALEGSTAHHKEVMVAKMADAVAAYDRGRFPEAAKLAKQVANEAPAVPAVRRLAGLAAYRAGRWREAIRQLDAYGAQTDEVDQVPALMDSHRALGRPRQGRRPVARPSGSAHRSPTCWPRPGWWPPAPWPTAATWTAPISLLAAAGAGKALRNPADRHSASGTRSGDLYERAGDLPRARELFERVDEADPGAFDVADRLAEPRPRRPRRQPQARAPSPVAARTDPAAGAAP